MKSSNVLKGMIAAICLAAGSASAIPTYTVDTLLGAQNLGNSSDAQELAALQTYVPSITGPLTKSSNVAIATQVPSTSNEWYIDLGSASPGYFVLKFGIGGTNATDDTFFFQNIGEMNLLVFTNQQVEFLTGGACSTNGNNCNIGRLSHYDYGSVDGSGGGVGGKVPEPGSLALMGLGMLGVVSLRKRNKAS